MKALLATTRAGLTPQAPANTVAPTITGIVRQGSLLTAHVGTWTGAPAATFTVEWQIE